MNAAPMLRIGNGFDVHAFAEGRKLILATLEIPHSRGLEGYSDADVLLHALTDAVLGALAWGDIGRWFPDTAPENKDIKSEVIFSKVWQKAQAEGWSLVNADSVIMAEEPKLFPYIDKMRIELARMFCCELEQIGLKATTTERLGFVGRREGMAASSVVLLSKAVQ